MSGTLKIELPRSSAMVEILDGFATLAEDDEIPYIEGELEGGPFPNKAEKLNNMKKAYEQFIEAVNRAIHPEIFEEPK